MRRTPGKRPSQKPAKPGLPKMQPKLRMFANASAEVSVVRAEHASSLAVPSEQRRGIDRVRGDNAIPERRKQLAGGAARGRLRAPSNAMAHVFIELRAHERTGERVKSTDDARDGDGRLPGESARRGNLVAATVKLSEIADLASRSEVVSVQLGDPLTRPTPVVAAPAVPRPPLSLRRFGNPRLHHQGRGVLIGIIDVEGFDFAHPDFCDGGQTRFLAIWDQGGTTRPPPQGDGPGKFCYGSEFLREHLQRAIDESEKVGLPPYELEPQSQMEPGSHGTHVASIVAGKRGVCPKAEIAAVLISLPKEDMDPRKTFYDSTRVIHAVEYLLQLADDRKMPISINISLGTNGHAHDATSPASRWIDGALSVPGRCVCVAAGNAGQEMPAFEGDIGYMMGRIHTSGRLAARELYTDVEWVVVGNGVVDVSENELEIWYGAADRFAVSIKPPGGRWIGPVEPQQFKENYQLPDGSFVSIYNELYHPANGSNVIGIYLSPYLSRWGVVGVQAGDWVVRLHAREVRDGRFDGWIERDDPRRRGKVGDRETWSFPSFFSERSLVDESTVSSLACGHHVISVSNLDEAAERIAATSSQGPTRDGRPKPEVAAAGTRIVAARGFDERDAWMSMSGTSMASPLVAGVAGLMLATNRTLTAAQVSGIIQRTARPLAGYDFTWRNDAGFGVINPGACLDEAAKANDRWDVTK